VKLRVEQTALWVGEGSSALAPAGILAPRERSRASRLTRAFAEVYAQLLSKLDGEASCASVFASSYGEIEAVKPLLEQVVDPSSDVSPLRFSASVHNAASGRLSIATSDRGFCTSIAAGLETMPAAWIEAAGLIASGWSRVALVIGEEVVPAPLGSGDTHPFAAGLLLSASGQARVDSREPREPSTHIELRPGSGPSRVLIGAHVGTELLEVMQILDAGCPGEVLFSAGRWRIVIECST